MMSVLSLQIPEGTQVVLPPFSSAQLAAIRSKLNDLNDKFGLWDGIAACLPEGTTFTGYSDEQVMWEYNIIWGKADLSIWCAARGFSKTWTSIDAYIKKMLLFKAWVVWIPGGSIEQTEQARSYFQAYFDTNLPLFDKVRGRKWTETMKVFRNGSFIKFTSASVRGVQSKRATDVHCDEGQLLTPDIYQLAKKQASMKGAKFALTGTAKADTLFHQTFMDTNVPFRMMTPAHLGIAAGIIDEQRVISDMNDPRILIADNLEQWWCIWQRLSDRAFNPIFVDTMPEIVPWSERWGWDLNPVNHHWGIKAAKVKGGGIIFMKEAEAETYKKLLETLDCDAHVESNSGYDKALQDDNREMKMGKRILPDLWNEDSKSSQVAALIREQEHERWFVYAPGCPIFKKNVLKIPFNKKGVPDKEKAAKLLLNPHVIDGGIHAGAAVTPNTGPDWSGMKFNNLEVLN